MPPTLITLIRHGEALHNVSQNYTIRDPPLTPLGESQCTKLSSVFPPTPPVSFILSSPLTRTIQTTLLSFGPRLLAAHPPKILAFPDLQETSENPCDTGSDKAVMSEKFPQAVWDWEGVDWEGWPLKQGRWGPDHDELERRAERVRKWLWEHGPDGHVVCVLHGGFLHFMTEDWSGGDKFPGTGWANTEFRSYGWKEGSGEGSWSLEETVESKGRRVEKPLGRAESRAFEDHVLN